MKNQKVIFKIIDEGDGILAQLEYDNNNPTLGNILFTAISAVIKVGKEQGLSVVDLIELISEECVRAMQCTGIDEDFKELVGVKRNTKGKNEKAA